MDEVAEKVDFYSLTKEDLVHLLKERFEASAYRSTQLFEWVYRKRVTDFNLMTNITKDLRPKLSDLLECRHAEIKERTFSKDGSCKYLLEVSPNVFVESVFIKQPERITLCVSSQYGCAMGCTFCRTATMGLVKNLSAGDIIRQVVTVLDDFQGQNISGTNAPFNNIVFMGMGEPLHNFEAVASAVKILNDDAGIGIGVRKITISTCGFVPGIKKFVQADLGVNLAISLSATTDAVRSKLMPINKRYPLADLIAALHEIPLKHRKTLTISYVLLAGINDTEGDIKRLPKLLHGLKAKVNLIPYNENDGLDFRTPPRERVITWLERLVKAGIDTTIRWSRGADIDAACGQLAVKEIKN